MCVCLCLQAHCEAYEAIKKMPIGKDLQVWANLAQQAFRSAKQTSP